MKKYIVVIVVMALVLVVAPWGIGRLAEQRVNAGLDQLMKQAPYLKIAERKWSSGWFRSQQEVTFEVAGPWSEIFKEAARKQGVSYESRRDPLLQKVADDTPPADAPVADSPPADAPAAALAEPGEPLRFTVRNEILHGPVLWPAGFGVARVNTHFIMSDQIRKDLEEIFGTDEPVRISTRVAFMGGGTTTFSVEGRTIAFTKDPGTMKYDDLGLDIGYSRNLDDLDFDGKWPHFEYQDSRTHETVAVDGIKMKGKSRRIRGDLYSSDTSFTIDKFRFVGIDKGETTVDGMHYIVGSSAKDDFLDYGIQVGSGKVRSKALADLKLDLDEVHYDFTLRHMHAATLEKLIGAIKESYGRPMTGAAEVNAAFTAPFKQYGLELLRHDPELAVDNLGIVTPDGAGVIKGVIRLKGVTEQDFDAGAMGLLPRLEADLAIEIAQKLIEKIPNGATSAGMAIDQGYARRDGERIVSRIEFNHGELKINGKAEAIPGMGGPGAGPPPEQEQALPEPSAPTRPAKPGTRHKAE